ncbi:MAG: hypothetical protein U1E14_11865 [Geminicoccaceae bacterium]
MRRTILALGLGALLLAGCTPMLDQQFAQPGLDQQVRDFYAGRAWERNAFCAVPRMRDITALKVVEDTPDRVVLDVRYFYYSDRGFRSDELSMLARCEGFESRQFTFSRENGGLRVVSMTGDQRPNGEVRGGF